MYCKLGKGECTGCMICYENEYSGATKVHCEWCSKKLDDDFDIIRTVHNDVYCDECYEERIANNPEYPGFN